MKKIIFSRYIKIIVVCIFVILVAVQAHKSFVLDEIDFPIVSHATSLTLKPIYYRGEATPSHFGTYHPTLYINSLALFIRLFGYNETTVRFFGIICTLTTAYLLVLILRKLTKKNDTTEAILLSLFLLNPYTIANTTLPDIDSTILPVVLLLSLYFALHYLMRKKAFTRKASLILGLLFGLALWSKLTTPLIIPPFLLCLAFITQKDYKKSIVFTLKVTAVGFISFIVTYFLYCKLLGLSTTYTYHFLIDSFTKGTSTEGPLVGAMHNLQNIRHFVFWPTIPVIGLIGVSSLGVLLDKNNDDRTKIKKLLVITAVLVTLFYIALISPFGGFFKYPFPVFGLLILTVALYYDRYLKTSYIKSGYISIVVLASFILEKIVWEDSMFLNAKPFSGLLLLTIIVVSFYIFVRINPKRIATYACVLCLLFSIGFQLSISRVQAMSSYPTKYHYGLTGLDETTSYLRANTASDEVIWSMKDVGYYTHNRYVESYGYYFSKPLEDGLIKMLKDSKVRYYVVSTGIGEDNIIAYPNIKLILDTYATREKQFGNFIIYKTKG